MIKVVGETSMSMFPECPSCKRPVSIMRALIGRGRSFRCHGCRTLLITDKAGAIVAIAIFGFLSIFGKRMLEYDHGWIFIVIAILFSGFFEYITLKVNIFESVGENLDP